MDQTKRDIDNLLLKARISRRTMTAGVVAGVAVVAVAAGGYFYILPRDSVPEQPTERESVATPPLARPPATTGPITDPISMERRNIVVATGENVRSFNLVVNRRGGPGTPAILYNIFEPFTYRGPPGRTILPLLAETIEPVDSFRITRIKLREEVKFHDGTDFDTEAVKLSMELYNSQFSRSPFFKGLKEVDVKDKYNVDLVWRRQDISKWFEAIHVSQPYMTSPTAYAAGGKDQLDKEPVGTGRLKLKEWIPGVRMVFEQFKDYWGRNIPEASRGPMQEFGNVEDVTIVQIQEPAAQLTALKNGDIDAIMRLEGDINVEARADPTLGLVTSGPSAMMYVYMNTLYEPLKDIRVRKAVNYAIDKQGLVTLLGDVHTPANGPLLPWHLAYDPNHKNYPHDPAKSKELLAEAGLKDGFDVTIMPAGTPYLVTSSLAMQTSLTELGLAVKSETMARGVWNGVANDTEQTDFHIFPQVISSEEDIQYFDYWFTKNRRRASIDHPFLDEGLDSIRGNTDAEARKAVYKEAAKYVFDESLQAWVWLHQTWAAAKKDRLKMRYFPTHSQASFHLWNVLS